MKIIEIIFIQGASMLRCALVVCLCVGYASTKAQITFGLHSRLSGFVRLDEQEKKYEDLRLKLSIRGGLGVFTEISVTRGVRLGVQSSIIFAQTTYDISSEPTFGKIDDAVLPGYYLTSLNGHRLEADFMAYTDIDLRQNLFLRLGAGLGTALNKPSQLSLDGEYALERKYEVSPTYFLGVGHALSKSSWRYTIGVSNELESPLETAPHARLSLEYKLSRGDERVVCPKF